MGYLLLISICFSRLKHGMECEHLQVESKRSLYSYQRKANSFLDLKAGHSIVCKSSAYQVIGGPCILKLSYIMDELQHYIFNYTFLSDVLKLPDSNLFCNSSSLFFRSYLYLSFLLQWDNMKMLLTVF